MTPADAWMPIDSAPRDTIVWVWGLTAGGVIESAMTAYLRTASNNWWACNADGGEVCIPPPTHWQPPLPPPPEATDGQEPQA